MYYFVSSIEDWLLNHIRDAKMPKEAWGNLKKFFAARTMTRNLQLQESYMSVIDYTARIKDICDSLASIKVTI